MGLQGSAPPVRPPLGVPGYLSSCRNHPGFSSSLFSSPSCRPTGRSEYNTSALKLYIRSARRCTHRNYARNVGVLYTEFLTICHTSKYLFHNIIYMLLIQPCVSVCVGTIMSSQILHFTVTIKNLCFIQLSLVFP